MAETPPVYRLPTYFHEGTREVHVHDEGLLSLVPGQGVLWGDGTRYRVVDSWFSFDHHGRYGEGMHVFLERLEPGSEDDTLGQLAPDYFGLT